jgi:HD superfamily phosphodiesterase
VDDALAASDILWAMIALDDSAAAWAARAPRVPAEWFARRSQLHGVSHTQRVHIHAQRLAAELEWPAAETRIALSAALWHDIGRTDDGVDPGHGEASARRAVALGLPRSLSSGDGSIVVFAVHYHSLDDDEGEQAARRQGRPDRALRVLRLLKDADALDRVRLAPWEAADPKQLRYPVTAAHIPFAAELYTALP